MVFIEEPYSGGWCRPQTDGPALRAMSMAKWGNILIDAGKEDEAKSVIWPLIEYDLGETYFLFENLFFIFHFRLGLDRLAGDWVRSLGGSQV